MPASLSAWWADSSRRPKAKDNGNKPASTALVGAKEPTEATNESRRTVKSNGCAKSTTWRGLKGSPECFPLGAGTTSPYKNTLCTVSGERAWLGSRYDSPLDTKFNSTENGVPGAAAANATTLTRRTNCSLAFKVKKCPLIAWSTASSVGGTRVAERCTATFSMGDPGAHRLR
jgi:hypothetical protein